MKTDGEYEELFESLMSYTSFRNVNQVQTDSDLRKYFSNLSRSTDITQSDDFKNQLSMALIRLNEKGTDFKVRQKSFIKREIYYELDESQRRAIEFKVQEYKKELVMQKIKEKEKHGIK